MRKLQYPFMCSIVLGSVVASFAAATPATEIKFEMQAIGKLPDYYVTRANSFEDNVSIYYMKDGRRHILKYVDTGADT
ncbi:MAG: hypothetical protein V3U76_13495 [Granulosicoccus sp.]